MGSAGRPATVLEKLDSAGSDIARLRQLKRLLRRQQAHTARAISHASPLFPRGRSDGRIFAQAALDRVTSFGARDALLGADQRSADDTFALFCEIATAEGMAPLEQGLIDRAHR